MFLQWHANHLLRFLMEFTSKFPTTSDRFIRSCPSSTVVRRNPVFLTVIFGSAFAFELYVLLLYRMSYTGLNSLVDLIEALMRSGTRGIEE